MLESAEMVTKKIIGRLQAEVFLTLRYAAFRSFSQIRVFLSPTRLYPDYPWALSLILDSQAEVSQGIASRWIPSIIYLQVVLWPSS